ncbi:MAG: hypothetical protein ACLGP3_06195 [Acidobacteriota bacterium]
MTAWSFSIPTRCGKRQEIDVADARLNRSATSTRLNLFDLFPGSRDEDRLQPRGMTSWNRLCRIAFQPKNRPCPGGVLAWDQKLLGTGVPLASAPALKPALLAGRDEPANPFHMQLLCLMRVDAYFPA